MGLKVMNKNGEEASDYDEHLGTKPTATVVVEKGGKKSQHVGKVPTEVVGGGELIPKHKLIRMTVEGSQTINLGDYNSCRIMVSLDVPTTEETLEARYEWASNWVSDKVAEAAGEAKGA